MENLKLHIWHNGDPAIGEDGDECIMEFHGSTDESMLNIIDDILRKAFSDIWDMDSKYIHIMTDKEMNKEPE